MAGTAAHQSPQHEAAPALSSFVPPQVLTARAAGLSLLDLSPEVLQALRERTNAIKRQYSRQGRRR
jgi:hypothetical protein